MNKIKTFYILPFIICITQTVLGQDTLTLQDAIKTGIENSYSIKIAENNAEISRINNTLGNSGFLPQIDLNAGHNSNFQNQNIEYSDKSIYKNSNYAAHATSAGVLLNWTIFDGMSMFVKSEQLSLLEDMGEIEVRVAIENLIAAIATTYLAIGQNERLYMWHNERLELSRQRLKIAHEKALIGSDTQLKELQAELDFTTDSTLMIAQRNKIINLKSQLNNLLNQPPDHTFFVQQHNEIPQEYVLQDVYNKILEQNTDLLTAKIQNQISLTTLKETRSARYPRVNLTGAYDFDRTATPEGNPVLSRIFGPSIGINASITLFNGFNVSRNIKVATIQANNQQLIFEDLESQLNHTAFELIILLNQALDMIKAEINVVSLATRNADIAMEKYRIGAISDVEVRETKNLLTDAQNRLISAITDAQTYEITLLVLMGELNKFIEN